MRHLTLLWITVVAATAPVALTAGAQTYQWVDEQGVAVYSSELPPQTSEIRDLAVVEGTGALSPLERRTLQIINEAARARSASPATLDAALPAPMAGGDTGAERPNALPPLNSASENTRDPCLLSWDPRCSERHAGSYDPRWGYAPSLIQRSAEVTTSAPSAPPSQAPGTGPGMHR